MAKKYCSSGFETDIIHYFKLQGALLQKRIETLAKGSLNFYKKHLFFKHKDAENLDDTLGLKEIRNVKK